MPEVINKSVQGIGFGFLHDDEIKKLSVKQVTNSQSFDSLRQPVIGGLYDRAFGTTDLFDFCDTCDLSEKDCPGHSGHIQLAVPLYDINLLDLLIKLLNSKCWHCHHLRVARLKKKSIYVQLLYLNAGQMLKAQTVADLMNQGAFRGKGDKQARLEEVLDQHLQQAVQLNAQATPVDSRLTFHILRARNELIKSFLKVAKQPKCQNCGATSPSVRRDGFTKIFVQSLNSKQIADNDKCGIKIHSILSKSQYDSEYIVASEPSSEADKLKDKKAKKEYQKSLAQQAKKSQKSKASDQNDGSSGSDDDGDIDNRDESDLDDIEDEFSNQANSTSTSEALFGESMHQLAEKVNKQDEKSKSSIHTTINSSTDVEETTSRLMLPNEVERHMALLWGSTDADFLSIFFCPGTRQQIASNPYNGNDYRAFFHRVLLVPPSRFRPPRYVAGEFFESSTNVSFRKIFDANEEIVRTVFSGNSTINPSAVLIGEDVELVKKQNHSHAVANAADTESKLDKLTPVARKRVVDAWISMQHELNLFFDSDKTGNHLISGTTGGNGIKQLLEKKQGLFRKHMMGKRVNYAARSVISPDPYLHTREIGVPEIFAKTLTFPEPVTSFNYDELRQAVINGPYVHPGANSIITSQGREIKLSMQSYEERVALANRLLGKTTSEESQPSKGEMFRLANVTNIEKTLASELVGDTGPMVVSRHLRSGDVLLVNRQPTLHKPSMMAHVARVLYGENVIRMHYANCNSYNADFDGDEMNLHFPQNQLARIEAYDIANNDNQYIVPTSGNPLRGLIQDHVVCGVRLTQRDTFLNREYFQQFLFLAIADRDVQNGNIIATPQPTILKPRVLWTGKQIINCILDFVAERRPPLNLTPTKAKIPGSSWGKQGQEDGSVIIRENNLVTGVLDKAMFGASKHGLVHAIYELYGAKAAGNMLTILARLFTRVLQYDAFTCGIEDFLLSNETDISRRVAIEQSVWDGVQATSNCAGLEGDVHTFGPNKINEAVQRLYVQHKNASEMLDNAVKAALSQNTSNIIKLCIPNGQRIPFPRNNMAMMTLSGAKGSAVNHSQIACLLGQQELEGRRVPTTMTGKTLPSFPKYDPQPRAGGYISQRFFTGIRPQEFYHHCMSGREGLVDTAVKTARSGYLQRCLIKLLEGLNIRYDNTVRDVDNSIVQFQYGEDGIDPVKAGYLTTMSFLASNFKTLMSKLKPFDALSLLDDQSVDDYMVKIDTMNQELSKMRAAHQRATLKEKSKIDSITDAHKKASEITKATKACREREDSLQEIQDSLNLLAPNDTIISKFPIGKSLGSVSEKYRDSYLDYISKDPDGTFAHAALMDQRWNERLVLKQNELKKKSESLKSMTMSTTSSTSKFQIIQDQITNLKEQIKLLEEQIENNVTPEKFTVLMNLYYMYNLAHPGENVGVLAGQSVGEPSTQMTLNTFHLAGHGGANVTLGIPRLREIVMTASPEISTPIMELPLKDPSPEFAIKLAAKLNKVKLSECLQSIHVTQTIRQNGTRQYRIRTQLKDLNSEWAVNNLITPYNIAKCVGIELARKLQTQVQTKLRYASSGVLSSRINRGTGEVMTSAEEDASLDDADAGVTEQMDASERRKMRELEEGASEQLRADKKKQQSSYDDEESGDEEGGDSDDDNDEPKVKKSSSDMNDIDTDNDEDDELFDEQDTSMTDKVKPIKKQSTKKPTSSSAKPAPLSTENDLAQEQDAGDFQAFCRKLIPYWGRYTYIDEIDFNHVIEDGYIDIIVTTPQGSPKLLMLSTMETICDVCRVRYTDGINKAIAIDRKLGDGRKVKIVQTDGVNFAAVTRYAEVDHVNIKTNDIHRILMTYGVEAASTAIRNEISGVFAVYGIVVDPRHLSLIADFMTFQGGYHAMNRNSIGSRPSVLQKATFETSMRFILDACQSGEYDHLTSPASSIVLGKPIQSGSGCFELRHPLPTLSK